MTAALGLLVGLILALTGAGGAIMAVPLLIFALNWDVARSGPVALVAVGASAALGAVMGLRQGNVRSVLGHLDFAVALPFAAGALFGMSFGRLLAPRIGGPRLQVGFAAVSAAVAFGLIVRTFAHQ